PAVRRGRGRAEGRAAGRGCALRGLREPVLDDGRDAARLRRGGGSDTSHGRLLARLRRKAEDAYVTRDSTKLLAAGRVPVRACARRVPPDICGGRGVDASARARAARRRE